MKLKEKKRRAKLISRGFTPAEARVMCSRKASAWEKMHAMCGVAFRDANLYSEPIWNGYLEPAR